MSQVVHSDVGVECRSCMAVEDYKVGFEVDSVKLAIGFDIARPTGFLACFFMCRLPIRFIFLGPVVSKAFSLNGG